MQLVILYILVNCFWGSWASWGTCTKPCEGGTLTSTRVKTRIESCGGTCTGSGSKTQSCNTQCCPGRKYYSINCIAVHSTKSLSISLINFYNAKHIDFTFLLHI